MPSKFQSVLIGGLVAAVAGASLTLGSQIFGISDRVNPQPVLSLVINLLGCMMMLMSGLVAVWHYTSENKLTVKAETGAKMGAVAGFIYAIGALVLGGLMIALDILPSPDETIELMRDTGVFDVEGGERTESIARMMAIWGAIGVLIIGGPIMAMVGGSIGANLFKKGPDIFKEASPEDLFQPDQYPQDYQDPFRENQESTYTSTSTVYKTNGAPRLKNIIVRLITWGVRISVLSILLGLFGSDLFRRK